MLFLMLLSSINVTFAAETAVAPSGVNENSARITQALQLMTQFKAAPNRNKLARASPSARFARHHPF